jgi:cytochrome P450
VAIELDDPGLLLAPEVLEDPRALYEVLLRDAPIWQVPGQDTFVVSSPALVREAVGRTEDFSSNLVSVVHADGHGTLTPFDMLPFGDPSHVIATADPPAHTRQRKVLQPHLSPSAVGAYEPMVTAVVEAQLARLLASERPDAVTDFADPVPGAVICEVLGLPVADAPRLVAQVGEIGMLLDGITDADGMSSAGAAALELLMYAQEHLDIARALPAGGRGGLLGVIADAIDGGDLSAEEAAGVVVLLVNAGTETTASLIATTIRTLAERPDLQAELRENPDGISATLEAILRDDGPFQFHYRYAPSDTALGDTKIPAGSRLMMMWAAANIGTGDTSGTAAAGGERVPPHFAFGRGLHFCIGAPLARLEARIAIERLLARTSAIALDPDDPPTRRPSILIRRHLSLPVIILET